MNLREEPAELKLLEFMVNIDLLIPLGEITVLKSQVVPAINFAQLNTD